MTKGRAGFWTALTPAIELADISLGVSSLHELDQVTPPAARLPNQIIC